MLIRLQISLERVDVVSITSTLQFLFLNIAMNRLLAAQSHLLGSSHNSAATQNITSSPELLRYGQYSYKILQECHRKQAEELLITSFKDRNPLISAFSRLKPHLKELMHHNQKMYWSYAMGQLIGNGMCVVICDTNKEDEVVAVGTVKDVTQLSDVYSQFVNNQYMDAESGLHHALMQMLEPQILQLLQTKKKVLELHGGAIKPELQGSGIFSKIFDLTISEGVKNGFEYSYAFTTNGKTKGLFAKHGFKVLAEIDCHKFQLNNYFPFILVEQLHRYPSIMIKKIR